MQTATIYSRTDIKKMIDQAVGLAERRLETKILGRRESIVKFGDYDPIDVFGFSTRVSLVLKIMGVKTVGDLRKVKVSELEKMRNFGDKSMSEVRVAMAKSGMVLW